MKHNYTVQNLLDYIEKNNVPKDAVIAYHRIEDGYFDGWDISGMRGPDGILPPGSKSNGWQAIKVKGDSYYQAIQHNKDVENANLVKSGKGGDPNECSKWFMKNDIQPIDLNDPKIFDEYIEAFYCYYDKETNLLCVTAHY